MDLVAGVPRGSVEAMNLAVASPAGRHVRRARRHAGVAVPAATAVILALHILAGPVAGAGAIVGGCIVVVACVWRTLAAIDADACEERWLRSVLDRLDAGDEDEGGSTDDLLVF
jgi:hypothetical protein